MTDEKEKAIEKDQAPERRAPKVEDELSDLDLRKVSGAGLKGESTDTEHKDW